MFGKKTLIWTAWLLTTLVLSLWLGRQLFLEQRKDAFLIGQTSAGHHQIELACEACHLSPFGGRDVLQQACVDCHGEELLAAQDSHPRSKFTDPRNAERLAMLDARQCVSCHREHDAERTRAMGVTLAQDFCFHCHQDIGRERASHAALGFESCASAGCHNYHDNRALYEDFLSANAGAPWLLPRDTLLAAGLPAPPRADLPASALPALPEGLQADPALVQEWRDSAHGRGDVDCAACHGAGDAWRDSPDHTRCGDCHGGQLATFLEGRHGMRLAQGLSAMTPALSLAGHGGLAFRDDAQQRALDCGACHDPHSTDRRRAAADACLGCHDDSHSRAFPASPHGRLWAQGGAAGVSCAGCHLPRIAEGGRTLVQHNQNANLRPNEKMIREVCMDCHSLAFSLDALADRSLIDRNFSGRPSAHIQSIEMALKRRR